MRVKDRLKELSVKPTRERGQNFLLDSGAITEIVRFGAPKLGEKIVEIGPGLGALTKELASLPPPSSLTVIELEPQFCRELKGKFPSITIINEDIRTVDLSRFGDNLVVFGNLPYSLSTEIVFHIIAHHRSINRAILMLQKEFVERMVAEPGGRDYGALSVFCQLHANMRSGPVVYGTSFHPPTKVDSQVVELTFDKGSRYNLSIEEVANLQLIVKAAFFRRRKKLVNSIKASSYFDPRLVDAALSKAEIDPGRRAETLSVDEYVRLTKEFRALKSALGTGGDGSKRE